MSIPVRLLSKNGFIVNDYQGESNANRMASGSNHRALGVRLRSHPLPSDLLTTKGSSERTVLRFRIYDLRGIWRRSGWNRS